MVADPYARRAALVRETAEIAHAVVDGDDVGPDLLALLARHVGADTTTLSVDLGLDLVHPVPRVLVHGDDLTEVERARWRELLPTHPYARYLASRPTLTTRMTECVVPEDVWGSQVYEELLAPRGMRYQAAATLGSGPTTMTLVCLWRETHDFDDAALEVVEGVRAAVHDAVLLRRRLVGLADPAQPRSDWSGGPDEVRLTPRQLEVVVLVARGLTNAQIGRRLSISERTVRKHVEDLFERVGCASRSQLAAWWSRGGAFATSTDPPAAPILEP